MPGKFEGEPAYAEQLYNLANEGMADDNWIDGYSRQVDYFSLHPGDDVDYDSNGGDHFLLWEDDQGFVYTKQFHSRDEAFRYMIDALGGDEWVNT